jgi:PKD repeat protein
MRKPTQLNGKSNIGQGLVEFALVLPLVLLMTLGIIDFGRIFYIYSASSNATREAVRIGSVDPNNCTAIDHAARSQLTFIDPSSFTVQIGYDDGMTSYYYACPLQAGETLQPGRDRIIVDVTANFGPLTPVISGIVRSLPIHYRSARTISYAPGVSAPPSGLPPAPPPPPPPAVTLSCTPDNGGAPLQTTCTADNTGGTVTDWSWSTGDGTSLSGSSTITHTYSALGTFTVAVVAAGPGGSDSASAAITVAGGPTANFTCDHYAVNTGDTVVCTDASSNGPTSGVWNWGDGTTANWAGLHSSVSHVYSSRATYTVRLAVANANGSSTASRSVSVYLPVTLASISCTPATGPAPLSVGCTASGVTGDVSSYVWDWGEGGSGQTTGYPGSHYYSYVGSYVVSLTVYGWGGGSARKTTTVAVTTPPPTANFIANPTSGVAPLTVVFTDTSTGTPTSWQWNFGDGTGSTTHNPTHIYTALGTYTVTLAATGSGGTTSKSARIAVVGCNAALEGSFAPVTGTTNVGIVYWTVTNTTGAVITLTTVSNMSWPTSNSGVTLIQMASVNLFSDTGQGVQPPADFGGADNPWQAYTEAARRIADKGAKTVSFYFKFNDANLNPSEYHWTMNYQLANGVVCSITR